MESERKKYFKNKIKGLATENKENYIKKCPQNRREAIVLENHESNNKENIVPEDLDVTMEKILTPISESTEPKGDTNVIIEIERIDEGENFDTHNIEKPILPENIQDTDFHEIKKITSSVEVREVENSENLQPTITEIIPEQQMDLIRITLNDDLPTNSENILPNEEMLNRKRKRVEINKSYVDFLDDEDVFAWDSTSWKETSDEDTDSSSGQDKKKKKKKKKNKKKRLEDGLVGDDGLRKKKINKKKQRKEARESGKEYVKKDGSIMQEKTVKPNPCAQKKCGNNCQEITEEKRSNIFKHYWGLSAEKKKDWIVAMCSQKDVKRKRNKESSYRSNSYEYFINDGEGRRQVCMQFLLKTLDISQKFVQYTVSNASMGSAKVDCRGKTVPANKTPEEVKKSAVDFLKSLPALPSHYSRKDSTRLYLPVEFKNIKNLYRIYKEDRTSKGVDVVSEKIFRLIFTKDFNLGFHVPKKDKCLKCIKYENQDESSQEYKDHLEEKEASKKRLECHRDLHKKNESILCTSFDLQKVLNTPYGESMLLYYSRKYAVFNLCFYESITRNGFCYLWGESDAKRGGVEIATILQKYIDHVDQRETIKCLILYSDSCPGQNKNKIALAAIHNALLMSKNLDVIQMNYLLPGHTEMTVDSIHSTIENSVRNTIVWAPSQWLTICQLARKEPAPYNAESLTHEDFKTFDDLSEKYFKSNLAGKISKIRVATFKKSSPNIMTVKYSMKEEAEEETIAIMSKPKVLLPKYKSPQPITKTKHNDLKTLCTNGVIPKPFHKEYLDLKTYSGKDVLIDSDVEDAALDEE